jgi:pimeloyl-ACP methyl ester carboxylesterase
MRGFERTSEFENRIVSALKARKFPAQVIWGAQDPALKMSKYAPEVCEVLGLSSWHQVRGKHFLQEDSPQEIAQLIASCIASQPQ